MRCLRKTLVALVTLLFIAVFNFAHAQSPNGWLSATSLAKDLEFPSQPSALGIFSSPKLAIYKPEGTGPFPALVLHHQCGGLKSSTGSWQNMSILEWAKSAVGRGYVALVVDSLGPRSVESVCMGATGGVNLPRGVRDAFQAAAHLAKQEYVDSNRIFFAGYSWGATLGVLASSGGIASALAPAQRFRAVVAFYPNCAPARPANGAPYEVVRQDIDRPLLVLMGTEDNETPPEDCISRLESLKKTGAPVEWNLYPSATHCWDCENLNGFRKTDYRGVSVQYRYDQKTKNDSSDKMFAFFEKMPK